MEDEAAAQFVKVLLMKRAIPKTIEVIDPATRKSYIVSVTERSLNESRTLTKATIGSGGSACGCCGGTGKA